MTGFSTMSGKIQPKMGIRQVFVPFHPLVLGQKDLGQNTESRDCMCGSD